MPESVESLPGEVKHIFEVLVLLPEVTGEEPVGNSAEMIEVVDVPMDPVEPEESSFWAGVQEDFAFNFSSPKKRWLNLGAFSKHSGKRLDTGHDYNEQNTGPRLRVGRNRACQLWVWLLQQLIRSKLSVCQRIS